MARSEDDIELTLPAYERACLERALRQTGGDVKALPGLLGDHPSPIYRKLARHGLAGVSICQHGRMRHTSGPLEICAACESGVEILMENRYK